MNHLHLALAISLATGCAAGQALDANALDFEQAQPTEAEPYVLLCGPVLSVPEGLMDLVQPAADRWSKATGCEVTYAPDGALVHTVAELFDRDGKVVWGATSVHTINGNFAWCTSVTVSLKSRNLENTFAHELGHCWGARGGIDGGGHTEDGILKAWHKPGDNDSINAESLELVCSSVPCAVMQPEEAK